MVNGNIQEEEKEAARRKEKADAYLRKASDNLLHAEHLTQAAWDRLAEWQPHRKFQKGELTTGQAAEELKCSVYQVVKACKEGRLEDAWKDESPHGKGGWWHISAASIYNILKQGYTYYADMDRAIESTQKTWIKQFTGMPK